MRRAADGKEEVEQSGRQEQRQTAATVERAKGRSAKRAAEATVEWQLSSKQQETATEGGC